MPNPAADKDCAKVQEKRTGVEILYCLRGRLMSDLKILCAAMSCTKMKQELLCHD